MSQNMITFLEDEEKNYSTGKVKLNVASMIGKQNTFNTPIQGNVMSDKPSKKKKNIGGVDVVTREDDLPETYTNTPYKDSYIDTDIMLRSAIMQVDIATSELREDIDEIRSSKTLRKKYDYLALMHGSLGNLLGNKISAARELNNSIKSAHDFEFKRTKEFKLNDQVDDTKAIMDTYNAFVSMPVSANPLGYSSPLGPSTLDLTLQGGNNLITSAIGSNPDVGFQSYLNNIKPEQAMMLHETNPDIKQVVLYNQDTFEKSFEIMNIKTGEVMHGLPKRNTALYMSDTVIDLDNKVARNINLDEVYDVVIIGSGDMNRY